MVLDHGRPARAAATIIAAEVEYSISVVAPRPLATLVRTPGRLPAARSMYW
jgi:hypothetical protein